MRLLQKTNLLYVLSSALLFLVAGIALTLLMQGIIEEEASEQLRSTEARIVAQLEQGRPVAPIPPVLELEKLPRNAPERFAEKDTAFFDALEKDLETFRQLTAVRRINGQTYRIVLRQMIVDRADSVPTIALALGGVLLLLLVLLALMNRVIFQRLWRPFYSSLGTLRQFSVYQSEPVQLQRNGTTEFDELNAVLFKLTEKTRSDFRTLKEFSENASHEMQTPLAVIQAKLDELLQEAALSEQQARRIQEASGAVKKLSRLNKTLLLLTKIENRQFIQTETVMLDALLATQLSEAEDFILGRDLQVHYSAPPAPVCVRANPVLAEALVSNLLRNSIRHNLPGGFITIRLTPGLLQISNAGKPLSMAPSALFRRFSKADAASPSLGLGLAIVQTICHLYSWQVSYTAADGVHTLQVNFSGSAAVLTA